MFWCVFAEGGNTDDESIVAAVLAAGVHRVLAPKSDKTLALLGVQLSCNRVSENQRTTWDSRISIDFCRSLGASCVVDDGCIQHVRVLGGAAAVRDGGSSTRCR